MALAFALRGAGLADSVDRSSYTYSASGLVAGEWYALVGVSSHASAAPAMTPTATGVTFTEQGTAGGILTPNAQRRMQAWRFQAAATSTLSITITATAATSMDAGVVHLGGSDATGPVVNTVVNSGTAATGTTGLTLPTFASAADQTLLFVTHSANEAHTPKAGYTSLYDSPAGGHAAPVNTLLIAYGPTNDRTPSATWTGNVQWAAVALEIKAAATGVTGTSAQTLPAFTQHAVGTRTVPTSSGTATQALAALTQHATGTRTAPTFTGHGAQTLQPIAQHATGVRTTPTFTGTAAQALAPVAQAATGTRTTPGSTGTATQTLPALSQHATGVRTTPTMTGASAQALPALTQHATGTRTLPAGSGAAGQTLQAFTQHAVGTRTNPTWAGNAAQQLAPLAQHATGSRTTPTYAGAAHHTLRPLTQHAAGTFQPNDGPPAPPVTTRTTTRPVRTGRTTTHAHTRGTTTTTVVHSGRTTT